MTVFRATALIDDQLREFGWSVLYTNLGGNSGLFNITAMMGNVCMPIYIRHLNILSDNDSSISKNIAVNVKDFIENHNDVCVFLLTRRGVCLNILSNKSDIENMLRDTKQIVESDFTRHAPLEVLVNKAIQHYADRLGIDTATGEKK